MTIRRRILVATLTIAGGVCCFQPAMRVRMEARLSEIVGGRVEIGSSKISFLDSTIAFRDIIIHPVGSIRTSKIDHAALKFSWSSVLYRNLKIERFLASEVHWKVTEPSQYTIPSASEIDGQGPSARPDPNEMLSNSIDAIIQPIKLKLVEESTRQGRAQLDVASRIKSVSARVTNAMPSDGSFNVLRQSSIADQAKKELTTIRQLMAEDRLARKQNNKAVGLMKSSLQQNFATNFGKDTEVNSKIAHQDALQLARIAVAKEWNRNRSIVQTALNCLTALQNPIDQSNETVEQSLQDSRLSSLEILSHLPVGFTRCVAGKAKGEIEFPNVAMEPTESKSGFELQFWNLCCRNFSEPEKPAIALKLNRQGFQNEEPWLVCTAQIIEMSQSDATQIQISLERKQNGQSKSWMTIQHANQGWAAIVSLPIQNCFENPATESIVDKNSILKEKAIVVAKLMGTTLSEGSQPSDLLIEVDSSSVGALEAILSPGYNMDSMKKRSQASIRGTELLNSELLSIHSRWEQLGDEHSRAHESWEASLIELNEQIQRLESAFKRTSRATSIYNAK